MFESPMFFESLMIYAKNLFYRLLPQLCALCHYPTKTAICDYCRPLLPILPHHCTRCVKFLGTSQQVRSDNVKVRSDNSKTLCGHCLHSTPPYERIYALFPYRSPISQWIIKLKFQQQLLYANIFAELMLQKINEEWYVQQPLPQLIIPIPLHPQRLRERGFNQAIEIAKPIAKALSIPIDKYGIQRIKMTAPQSQLSLKEREQNIEQAFYSTKNYSGLRIALLDDVITTGSTVVALCKILKQCGAAHIDVWCCARQG